MSTKHLFLTHDTDYVGKKTNNLPMTGGTCTRNGGFLCLTSAEGGNHE